MNNWFSDTLITWYNAHKRDLPWRDTSDPYAIWLSEIILQQTQVAQGLAYYHRFLSTFPNVTTLAAASEDEVLKLWQGLGYYSRARNLHATAKLIVALHKGRFPNQYADILNLKGVGDYTAAAIASFAFNLPHAVVDGNVYRVLSRLFGIDTAIDSTQGKKIFKALAQELLNVNLPALHNQAIMEFGSQFCKPVSPDCSSCIFAERCEARQQGRVDSLPFKEKKTAVRPRFFHYLVLRDQKGHTLVHKRAAGDIWQGLYEFALLEIESERDLQASELKAALQKAGVQKADLQQISAVYKHVLSHQHLFVRFYSYEVSFKSSVLPKTVSPQQLLQLPFPRLIEKYLEDCVLPEMS